MTRKDSEKLQLLYELYEQPMYRIAYAVLHDSSLAEDAVSDAFVRIIDKLYKFREIPSDKTKAYIVKVIKSTSINIYRKNKRKVEQEMPIDDELFQYRDDRQNVEQEVFERNGSYSVDDMLKGVSEADRKIIMLRCRDGLSWRQVSEKMSVTETNCRKRFERSRKRILAMKGEISDEK